MNEEQQPNVPGQEIIPEPAPYPSDINAVNPVQPEVLTPVASVAAEQPAAEPMVVSSPPDAAVAPAGFLAKYKKLLIPVIALLVVLFGGGGYAMFYYIPNLPENVWTSGLSNVGKELEALNATVGDPAAYAKVQKSRLTVTGTGEFSSSNVNLTSTTDTDGVNSVTNADLSLSSGENKLDITADLKTIAKDGAALPDMYLKVAGISALGLGGIYSQYDNKWISITAADLKALGVEVDTSSTGDKTLSQDDVAKVSASMIPVVNKYLFTSDKSLAVLKMNEFKATETIGSLNLNKYSASYNPENVQKLCVDLANVLFDSEAYKKVSGASDTAIATSKTDAATSCETDSKKIDATKQYDVWMNKDNHTFYKMRIPDENNAGSYVDIGQNLDLSKDTATIFMESVEKTASSDLDIKLALTINYKTLAMSASFDYKDNGTSGNSGTITMKLEPYDGSVDATIPSPATSIMDLMSASF